MKAFVVLGASILVLLGGSFGAVAAGTHSSQRTVSLFLPLGSSRAGYLQPRHILFAMGDASTATGTVTPGTPTAGTATPGSPTPSPSPTASPYPDPVTILQNFATVYTQIQRAHIELTTIAEKPKVEKLSIDGIGDATCKGPGLKLTVKASDALEGTNQAHTAKVYFLQLKKTTEAKLGSKNAKWQKVKNAANVAILGFPFPIENPLACPSPTGSSGGSGGTGGFTDVSKDVVNLGPDSFQGNPVWHIHFVDVRTDPQGNSVDLVDDFLIGQAHYLPYVLSQSFDDTQDGITITESQITTKIGEKVSIKLHKFGTR